MVSGVAMGGLMGGAWVSEVAARMVAEGLLRRRRERVAEGIIKNYDLDASCAVEAKSEGDYWILLVIIRKNDEE